MTLLLISQFEYGPGPFRWMRFTLSTKGSYSDLSIYLSILYATSSKYCGILRLSFFVNKIQQAETQGMKIFEIEEKYYNEVLAGVRQSPRNSGQLF